MNMPKRDDLDDLVSLAAEICSTPMSLVTVIDGDLLHVISSLGTEVTSTDQNSSFCKHAIQQDGLFIVEDASKDPRFQQNPFVDCALGIRFYAGLPLRSAQGIAKGTLCVADTVPRQLTGTQRKALITLGRQVQTHMDLLAKHKALEEVLAAKEDLTRSLRDQNSVFCAFMNNGPFVSYIKDNEGRFVYYNDALKKHFGVDGDAWIGRSDRDVWPPDIANAFRAHDLEVLEAGHLVEIDEVSPNPASTPTHWKSYKFPLHLEQGGVLLAGISVDLTDNIKRQKALEAALQKQIELTDDLDSTQLLLQIFMHNSPHRTYVKSADGRYLFYNTSFANHFGINSSAWIGKRDYEVLPRDIADFIRTQELDLLTDNQPTEIVERLRDRNNDETCYRSLRFSYRDPAGTPVIAGMLIDLN